MPFTVIKIAPDDVVIRIPHLRLLVIAVKRKLPSFLIRCKIAVLVVLERRSVAIDARYD